MEASLCTNKPPAQYSTPGCIVLSLPLCLALPVAARCKLRGCSRLNRCLFCCVRLGISERTLDLGLHLPLKLLGLGAGGEESIAEGLDDGLDLLLAGGPIDDAPLG